LRLSLRRADSTARIGRGMNFGMVEVVRSSPVTRATWPPFAALLAGALAISWAPILVRLSQTGPASAGFWRLALAVPLLALVDLRGRQGPGRPSPLLAAAGVMFALDLACWHYGIRYTSVANATVLPNLTPVLVTLAGWFFLEERPGRIFLAGMAAAVAGAVVMALSDAGHATPGRNPPLGDALSAATAVWYGLYLLLVRGARAGRTTLQIMAWTSLTGAPILFAIALALREPILPAGPGGWAALAGLALVQVAGQGSIAWALGRVPAATAAVVVLVQPVASALLAFLLFAEAIGPVQAAGGALALIGVAVAQLGARAAEP
jgi:drug/metabolite transporter (DMT)-like permease